MNKNLNLSFLGLNAVFICKENLFSKLFENYFAFAIFSILFFCHTNSGTNTRTLKTQAPAPSYKFMRLRLQLNTCEQGEFLATCCCKKKSAIFLDKK
jgi:hypothetical protein